MIPATTLQLLESKFGEPKPIKRRTVSQHDERTKENLIKNPCMIGADRMTVHNYAPVYSTFLPDNLNVLVELGFLQGVGLAVWCELYPEAQIIGLDIDGSYFIENLPFLFQKDAFRLNQPIVNVFDELADNTAEITKILNGEKIDVMIDDALHYDNAILKAFADFHPHMAKGGVYFIEDNRTVADKIAAKYPQYQVFSHGEITVIKGFEG